jgi:hypothetical protein
MIEELNKGLSGLKFWASLPKLLVFQKNISSHYSRIKLFLIKDHQKIVFLSTNYIKFSKTNRLVIWFLLTIIMAATLIGLLFNVYQLSTQGVRLATNVIDKMPALQSSINKNKIESKETLKKVDEVTTEVTHVISRFASEDQLKAFLNEIITIFESNTITVMSQTLNFSTDRYASDSFVPKKFSLPSSDPVIPQSEQPSLGGDSEINATTKTGTKESATQEKTNKTKPKTVTKNKVAKKEEQATKENITFPKELRFMTLELIMRGDYLDYLRARKLLVRYLNVINIPIEEIAINDTVSKIEYRIIVELPFITSNNLTGINKK